MGKHKSNCKGKENELGWGWEQEGSFEEGGGRERVLEKRSRIWGLWDELKT